MYVDMNCDLGESFGSYTIGRDREILDYITSVNIACGFHAGDQTTMRRTVKMALEKGVGIGAHPGLQDLVGFGRRQMAITAEEAYNLIVYQIGALYGFVRAEGGHMQHVKAHGALYNMAGKDKQLAEAVAEAVYDVDPELVLFGLSGSEIIEAGKRIGLATASEVFADRTYQEDGSLTSRAQTDALIHNYEKAAEQVIRMVKEGRIKSQQGPDIAIVAHTICIHGDGKYALDFAGGIKSALRNSGVSVRRIGDFLS